LLHWARHHYRSFAEDRRIQCCSAIGRNKTEHRNLPPNYTWQNGPDGSCGIDNRL